MTEYLPGLRINTTVPHSARIWNYWMGGTDKFPVDREAGDAYVKAFPGIVDLARQSRQFLMRAVGFLTADAGIRQFLDIGTGLPTMQNTHQVAQGIAPESRVVYVDNDPSVLTHARALLTDATPEGVTAYINADLHNPSRVLEEAGKLLDFAEPIAVMYMGVLGHVAEDEELTSIVARTMAGVPAGSHLVLWDSTDTSDGFGEAQQGYDDTGAVPYVLRSPAQVGRCFDGLEMLPPGLVPISRWRPGDVEVKTVDGYGAVARKV